MQDDIRTNFSDHQNSNKLIQSAYDKLNFFKTDPSITPSCDWVPGGIYNRYGYDSEIPGFIAELIAQCNCIQYMDLPVIVAQDKQSQCNDQIDFWCGDFSFQVKAAITTHWVRIGIRRDWVTHSQATYLALVDIMLQTNIMSERTQLLKEFSTRSTTRSLHIDDLKDISLYGKINNDWLYS
jgi:hypothetical protein